MTAFDHVPRIRGRTPETQALRDQHARILGEAILAQPAEEWARQGGRRAAGATELGDPRKLRGIPALARGVGGTSPGTSPLAETLRRQRRRDT